MSEFVRGYTERKMLSSKVMVIAKVGGYGDWCAYCDAVLGINHDDEEDKVLRHGDKIAKNVAEILFPRWKHLWYRE
jgi:hypothetical protein